MFVELEALKAFLRESSASEAKALLAELQDSIYARDFCGFTAQQHLDSDRHNYGLSS